MLIRGMSGNAVLRVLHVQGASTFLRFVTNGSDERKLRVYVQKPHALNMRGAVIIQCSMPDVEFKILSSRL